VEGFDVSGLDEPWDEDEVCTGKTGGDALPDQRRVGICPGHERTLPVNELVHLLDMKEEGTYHDVVFCNFITCKIIIFFSVRCFR